MGKLWSKRQLICLAWHYLLRGESLEKVRFNEGPLECLNALTPELGWARLNENRSFPVKVIAIEGPEESSQEFGSFTLVKFDICRKSHGF